MEEDVKFTCEIAKLLAWDDTVTCETCPIKHHCLYEAIDAVVTQVIKSKQK